MARRLSSLAGRRYFAPALQLCVLLLLLAVLGGSRAAAAFRFTLVPGKVKCFTSEQPEEGRYELRYRMSRSLIPFVSVAVTTPGGRVLMEHEVAKLDAREIITLKQATVMSICFNTAAKAKIASVSLNVTLDIIDAEDAELTRLKKQSYSTSSPIALGAGKGSGALQQMKYIFETMMFARGSFVSLNRAEEDIRFSLKEAETMSWILVYIYVAISIVVIALLYMRLRKFMVKRKLL